MTYQPNFADPRVRARAERSLGFVRGCVSDTKSTAWSTRHIDRYLGQQQLPLSRWLRKHLLTVTDNHWNHAAGVCKRYVRNPAGVEYVTACVAERKAISFEAWQGLRTPARRDNLRDLVEESDQVDNTTTKHTNLPYCIGSQNTCSVDAWVQAEHGSELSQGEFEYEDISSRLWHPLQRLRREYRPRVLAAAGLAHQYDIVCCAPTLLHQHSWRIPQVLGARGGWQQGPMDLVLSTLTDYIPNRAKLRAELAERAEISIQLAKQIITALFCGAHISRHPTSAISEMLSGDSARIEFLKQDPWLRSLREDIAVLWDYLNRTIPRRYTATGRKLPISSRQKWMLYFELERSVLDSVRAYMKQHGIKCFLEHDGWTCDREIDPVELSQCIEKSTGFCVELEYRYYTT
jgi:hypothetical protein